MIFLSRKFGKFHFVRVLFSCLGATKPKWNVLPCVLPLSQMALAAYAREKDGTHVTSLSKCDTAFLYLCLVKGKEKLPKKKGFWIPTEPLKSLDKKEKTHEKARKPSQGEKTRKPPKHGKEGQGVYVYIYIHTHLVLEEVYFR